MMHLLFFINSLSSGGAERVTTNLANYWIDKGWKITVVSMEGIENDFYELHPNIHRINLQLDAKSSNTLNAIRNNIRRVKVLHHVLKKEQPDIALGIMNTANCLLSIAARGTGVMVIGSERTYPPKAAISKIWSWIRKKSYPSLAAVVAQTEETAQWLRTQVGVHRVPVIPNPVVYPLDCYEPCIMPEQIIGDSCDNNILLAVGRLELLKGYDRLLKIFYELSPRFHNWHLVIVGEGTYRYGLEKQITELGLEKNVSLPGRVGNIGDWYKAADIYIMTSHYEGFPNTLIEALSHGLPAVSVDCETGPRDIIRHEIDGLLVPQDDHATLVKALNTLMSNEKLRLDYATRAVQVRERFSLQKVAFMWEELFFDVREKNKP